MASELAKARADVRRAARKHKVEYNSKWIHKKTGEMYRVLKVCHDESDPERILVVYTRAVYDEQRGMAWCRPLEEWLDGRYALIEDAAGIVCRNHADYQPQRE